MLTPVQRFTLRREAEKRAAELSRHPQLLQASDSLHIKLIALNNDLAKLKSLPLLADKINFKKNQLLPAWQPVAQEYLTSGRVYHNLIFVYCMIWLFDTRQFSTAINWALVADGQGQPMPSTIRSTIPAFVARQIYEWAVPELESGRSVEPWFSEVFQLVTGRWQIHEKMTASYYRLAALLLLRDTSGKPRTAAVTCVNSLLTAEQYLARAHDIYPKISVRTLRERIAMRLRALGAAAPETC